MQSVWSHETQLESRTPLMQDRKTDVCIIGGGMAGLLTAYLLDRRGVEYVLIEAEKIAGGITKNTTAKITVQHALIYDKLRWDFGQEAAAQYAMANQEALQMYADIVKEEGVDCHFERIPAYLYAIKDDGRLESEYKAADSAGIRAVLTDRTTLPFHIAATLRYENQAQFQPLAFLSHIAKGLSIYENTKALAVEGHTVTTERAKITADRIVVATHFPFINAPGYYFARMHQERSYVLALTGAAKLDGAYLGIDDEKYSLRNYNEYLLLGGGGHRTGENEAGGKYAKLKEAAEQFFPQSREVFRWSAQDCVTHDLIPYIGQYSKETENMYVATGFRKWGMTSSMAAAMILADELSGRKSRYDLFSPQRGNVPTSIKSIVVDGLKSAAGLMKQNFQLPTETLAAIGPGESAVVDAEGEKAGVYKTPDGTAHVVSVKCPHLGCQLAFNPDELTWECPCHGSRYDYEGRLLDNPSLYGLKSRGSAG